MMVRGIKKANIRCVFAFLKWLSALFKTSALLHFVLTKGGVLHIKVGKIRICCELNMGGYRRDMLTAFGFILR
jgi:hypothetical protein